MADLVGLGTVVASNDGPTAIYFDFIISEITAREYSETGTFIQTTQGNDLVLGVIQGLRRANRYFSSPDIIHGSSQSSSVPSVYPADRWDYLIASVRVLGRYRDNIRQRATKPVLPGSTVESANDVILENFLGLTPQGLHLGKIRQTDLDANISIDKLLQKHLAILSISGGGKSYTTSVIIEELLRRKNGEGRPAVIVFDVHGEYRKMLTLNKQTEFKHVQIKRITADEMSFAIGHLSTADFRNFFPSMSYPQSRELDKLIAKLKRQNKPISAERLISEIIKEEMNQMVKDALLGWIQLLKNTRLFGNSEYPLLNETIETGKLIIFDLSKITSLWIKQIIVHYYLTRLFSLRRDRLISPVISFVEEAHQFAPEIQSSPSKSVIQTIAREGRKFLCSLVLISQRPVNLSTTALSQCNTHLILRILNPHDLAWIAKSSEGINQETLGMITSLGIGEGLLVGAAVNYPVFIQIRQKLFESEYDDLSLVKESMRYEKIRQSHTIN